MNNQFIETNNEVIITDEKGNTTKKKNTENSKEILALENLLEKSLIDEKELEEKLEYIELLQWKNKNYKFFTKFLKITEYITLLFIGVLIATILRLPIIILTTIELIPENIFSLIMKYSNIVISIPFTIISSITIEKRKSSYKNSLIQKLKIIKKTKEQYYQELERQKSISKSIEKTNQEKNIYEFNHNILNNSSYEYYNISNNKDELFHHKTKTKQK